MTAETDNENATAGPFDKLRASSSTRCSQRAVSNFAQDGIFFLFEEEQQMREFFPFDYAQGQNDKIFSQVLLLFLSGFLWRDLLIELGGAVAGDAERLPAVVSEVFGEQDDLTDVMGVVSYLAVYGLHDRMRFVSDGDGAD